MAIQFLKKYYYYIILILFTSITACNKNNSTNSNSVFKVDYNKKYNEVCFLMTHNAFNYEGKYLIPNQSKSITAQLNDGVRGLMIDTYDGVNGAIVYHGLEAGGSQPLGEVLAEIKLFLDQNKKEIVSIIFENNGSNTMLLNAINESGLQNYAYTFSNNWQTLNQMITDNKRLVIFVERRKTPTEPWLMYAWDNVFDTKYTYSSVADFDCTANRGTLGNKNLFLINHWLGGFLNLPDKTLAPAANKRSILSKRVQDCTLENNHFLNFLGVDFYDIGDAKAIVDSINGF